MDERLRWRDKLEREKSEERKRKRETPKYCIHGLINAYAYFQNCKEICT